MGAELNVERAVRERYAEGARSRQEDLCCPVEYESRYLEVLPREVIDRDYGCGNPARHLQEGETVLDLGSGTGKICYIAAQVVGPSGRVIGVDVNEEMLAIARRHRATIAERLGFDNTEFLRGNIQDLRTSLDAADELLRRQPIASANDLLAFEEAMNGQRRAQPLVADASVDVVVSNCVLNLVRDEDKTQLFREMFRVLRRGGRAIISDIVADEPVPDRLKSDPTLWSGCLSGAFQEAEFLKAFEAAGFYGMEVLARQESPWQTVEGIEFRSVTVRAYRGKEGPCLERNQAVLYRGPWSEVRDDDGHTLVRGVPMAVCEKTFQIYTRPPYERDVFAVEPRVAIPRQEAKLFDCRRATVRTPRETKGEGYSATTEHENGGASGTCCGPRESGERS